MSRETVVWTTSKPVSLRAEATSACVDSARSRTRSRIVFCLSRLFIECEKLAQYAEQDVDCLVYFVRTHRERRREANDVLSSGKDEESVLGGSGDDIRRGRPHLDADQQPTPTQRADAREALERRHELGAPGTHTSEQLVVDHPDDGARRSARHRITAEGRAMVPRCERTGRRIADEKRSDREAVRKALGERHEVWPHAELLEGK